MTAVDRVRNALPLPLLRFCERVKRALFPSEPLKRLRRAISALGSPTKVMSGPFAGMTYVNEATGSAYLPKIVGTYEGELHGVVEELLKLPLDRVIDIGTAEGYYAVGFAVRHPKTRVIGYDIDRRAKFLLNRLADANEVRDRLEIRHEATPQTLQADLSEATRPLVICDCEGFEGDVLDPSATPAMRKAILLVEVHDFIRPGVGELLCRRFEATHVIESIPTWSAPKVSPALKLDQSILPLLEEGRPAEQVWLYMKPRDIASV